MSIAVDFNVVGGVVDNVVVSVVVSVVCGDVTVGIFNVSSDPDFSLAALTTTVVVPSVEALLFFAWSMNFMLLLEVLWMGRLLKWLVGFENQTESVLTSEKLSSEGLSVKVSVRAELDSE